MTVKNKEQEKKPKIKVGRPSKYKKKFCNMLIEHMQQGFSFETFGALINVHKDTLYAWVSTYPEFSDAKGLAFGLCQFFWEKIGIDGTQGKIKNFQSKTWDMNMKNRFRWSDKVEHLGETLIVNIPKDDANL